MLTRSRSIVAHLWRSVVTPLLDMMLPHNCPACGGSMSPGQRYVCTGCRLDVPLTRFCHFDDNPMSERVRAIRPEIEHASALMFYIHGSEWRDIIHRFKYEGEWRHGANMGRWLGSELRESEIYEAVDCVVAVPLHPLRRLWRGYNQSEEIAAGVAQEMGVRHIRGAVRRVRFNKSQVSTERDERWQNVEGLFEVVDAKALEGRNILLVDDVFTTGATLLSCGEAILDSVPRCHLWMATLAVSNREMGYAQEV